MPQLVTAVRLFMAVEAVAFLVVSLLHAQVLGAAAPDPAAAIAEGLIAAVLTLGLVLTWVWPARIRGIGIAAQAFALALTSLGTVITLVFGGANVWDLPFHLAALIVLVWGLLVAVRGGAAGGTRAPSR